MMKTNDFDVDNLKKIVKQTLPPQKYEHSKVQGWVSEITSSIMKNITANSTDHKYIGIIFFY